MTNRGKKLWDILNKYGFSEWRKTRKCLFSDLTALISEHYYPKEFVEWWGKILIETHGQYGSMEIPIQIGGLRTMDEIFEYWKENER